jgi:hypothetical protein
VSPTISGWPAPAGIILALGLSLPCGAQPEFTHRGFIEWRSFGYFADAPNDSAAAVGEARLRYEGGARLSESWAASYAAEAAFDTHRQFRRDLGFFWFDRSLRRPALSLRRFSLRYTRRGWEFEAGKQLIRWGQTDLWSPTDRFAPRDLLFPLDADYLAVTAARAAYRRGSRRVEAVYVPRFTPGRLPLPRQRWLQPPAEWLDGTAFRDIGNVYPGGGQFGIRLQQTLHQSDVSVTFFEGFNHAPSATLLYNPYTETLKLRRDYPRARMLGGDFSRAMSWLTVRAEAGWFRTTHPFTDDYVQYVVEAERAQGRWLLIGGYVGEAITADRAKNRIGLDRSLTDLFMGRVLFAIDDRNEVKAEFLARRSGDVYGGRAAYTRSFGRHWRGTAGGAWLAGDAETVLGQYRLNSHVWMALRWSY